MNALLFLGIAVGLSLAGCLVLWLRSRQPGSMDAHIGDFARELEALAPGSPLDRPRGRQAPRDLTGEPGPSSGRPPGRPAEPDRTAETDRPTERGTGRHPG